MKQEIEYKWIVNLLNSDYLKGGFFKPSLGGCKKDFEKVAQAPENSKEFLKFFKELIEIGTIESCGKKSVGRSSNFVDHYLIIYVKLEKRLRSNVLYFPSKKIFDKDRVI